MTGSVQTGLRLARLLAAPHLEGWQAKGDPMDPSREVGEATREGVEQGSGEAAPRLGPEHQRLEVFIGGWTAEGVLGEAAGPQARVKATAVDRYEWLPGGFFLSCRGVMRFAGESLESTRIIGFDPERQRYRMHLFDNHGYARVYEGGERDGVWTFAGAHERVTMSFEDGNQRLDIRWEQSDDGATWRPLCDLKATRVH
ncbi:DUF1579 domain-containing protein [Corallococcus sp. CA047B]|nr:DUF1579 domain-containing protein [Corallococcus sp. CA047B]